MRSRIRANPKRLISDQNNPVGCRGCELPILGSNQGGQVVKQYMRAGNKEDPWISAGHHPAEIVYGENGYAGEPHDWHLDAFFQECHQ